MGRMRKPDDLHLRLRRDGETYSVVAQSPSGTAEGMFSMPFSERDLGDFIHRVTPHAAGTLGFETTTEHDSRSFGQTLFGALFQDEILDVYLASRARAARRCQPLRITLHVAEVPELGAVPWEFLHDGIMFPGIDKGTPLVRRLDVPIPRAPAKIRSPLRVLGMVSSPPDQPDQLDKDREHEGIESALAGLIADGRVEIEWCREATLEELHGRLMEPDFHVFHFVGHGRYEPAAQDGVLFFEGDGGSVPVPASHLGGILAQVPDLRLAVINACQGARGSSEDPFGSVAAGLIRRGIPAVVAMQFDITVDAARLFTKGFYQAVATGEAVDVAVAYGRGRIHSAGKPEWATPVLFLEEEDGHLFVVNQSNAHPAAPQRSAPSTTVVADLPGVEVAAVHRAAQGEHEFHIVLTRSDHECVIAMGSVSGPTVEGDFDAGLVDAAIRVHLMGDGTPDPPLLTVADAKNALRVARDALGTDVHLSAVCTLLRSGDVTELDLAWVGAAPMLLETDGTWREISEGVTVSLEPGRVLAVCTQEVGGLTPILKTVETSRERIAARIAAAISAAPDDGARDMAVAWVRTRRRFADPHVVTLRGYVDLTCARALRSEIQAALDEDNASILLDMTDVRNVDPLAVAFLPDLAERARDAGGDLRVVALGRAADVFHRADALATIPVFGSSAAATHGAG